MAHFVKLSQDNIVIEGYVVNNDALDPDNEEQSGKEFLNNLYGTNDDWMQTSQYFIRKNDISKLADYCHAYEEGGLEEDKPGDRKINVV